MISWFKCSWNTRFIYSLFRVFWGSLEYNKEAAFYILLRKKIYDILRFGLSSVCC